MNVTKEKRKEYYDRYMEKKRALMKEMGIEPRPNQARPKPVVVFDGDEIIDEVQSIKSFVEKYCPSKSKDFVSARLKNQLDGWLPNGLRARFKNSSDVKPCEFVESTSEYTQRLTLKEELKLKLAKTEEELEEVEDKYRAAEIGSDEKRQLFEKMCLLQSRYYSTKNRLYNASKKREYM